jgi:hypothetical protein
MSVTDTRVTTTGLPVGTWHLDPTHSSASFAVKHMVVATFRGRFEKFDATLVVDGDSAELTGVVDAGSVVVKDENLQAHLGSPDFWLVVGSSVQVPGEMPTAETWSAIVMFSCDIEDSSADLGCLLVQTRSCRGG